MHSALRLNIFGDLTCCRERRWAFLIPGLLARKGNEATSLARQSNTVKEIEERMVDEVLSAGV